MAKSERWTQIKRIANAVANCPGLTGAELSSRIQMPGAYRRLSEIARMGLVKKEGRKLCSMSNKLAATWYPDDRKPEPDRGKLSSRDEIKRLKGRIEFLEAELAKRK